MNKYKNSEYENIYNPRGFNPDLNVSVDYGSFWFVATGTRQCSHRLLL